MVRRVNNVVLSEAEMIRAGALWSVAGTSALRIVNMIIMVLVVRIMAPTQYGAWAAALAVYTVVAGVAELGARSVIIRRDTDLDVLGPAAVLVGIISSSFFATLMFLAAPAIAAAMGASAAAPAIRVMALPVLIAGIVTGPVGLLNRDFRQREYFIGQAAAMLTSSLLVLGLAIAGAGVMAFAWSQAVGHVVAAILFIRMAGGWIAPRWDRSSVVPVLRIGVPLAAVQLVNYSYLNLDYALIGRGLGAASLGIYLLAFNISSWPNSAFGLAITSVGMPAFSDAMDGDALQRRMERAVQAVATLAFPVSAILTVLAHPLIAVLYGPTWTESATVLSLLAPYGAIYLLTLTLGNALVGIGRPGRLLVLNTVWLATLAPVMYFAVEANGLRGAPLAHIAVGLFVACPAYLVVLRRVAGIDPGRVLLPALGPLLFAAIAAAVAVMVVRPIGDSLLQLLVGGGAAAVCFAATASPVILTHAGSRIPILSRLLGRPAAATERFAARLGLSWLYVVPSDRLAANGERQRTVRS